MTETSPPITPAQALFAERAQAVLRVDCATISCGEDGILIYHWKAPCDEVAGLWLHVHDGDEIMLSSRLSHTHIERWEFAGKAISEDDIWPNMVDAGIAQARDMLRGETVFIRSYGSDENGTPSCSIWTRRQWVERQSRSHVHERAWNWFGEVLID